MLIYILQAGLFFAFLGWITEKIKALNLPRLAFPSKPKKTITRTIRNYYTNKPVTDFIFSEPHFLIGGATGSGKSNLLQWLLVSLSGCGRCNRFILVDVKRVEFSRWAACQGFEVVTDSKQATSILHGITAEIETEYKRMQKAGLRESDKKFTVIIIDELADLMLSDERKQIEKDLQRIAQIGRAAHFKLIVASQLIRADIITLKVTSNITGRICLHCERPLESRQIINENGGEQLAQYGEGLFYSRGKLEKQKIPYISDEIINDQIKALI